MRILIRLRRLPDEIARGVLTGLLLGGLLIAAMWTSPGKAAEELPACTTAPALIVRLPQGAEVPASRLVYDLSARRVEVVGDSRVFCGGFE